ncbi:MAG: biopolymer transporter ExbD [Pseudomonadota bacterium]
MRIPTPPKPPRGESIIPMINVVFLLLIFFLITAQIRPPEPFEVVLPITEERDPAAETLLRLYLSAEGVIAYEDLLGEDALAAALGRYREEPELVVQIRADAGVEGSALAILLRRLAEGGIKAAELMTAGS